MVRGFAGAAVLFAVLSGPVHAVPITDTVNPAPDVFLSSGGSPSGYSFVHDITDDGFTLGDIISSASITIRLEELFTTGQNNETFLFTLGGGQTRGCPPGNCVPNPGHTEVIALTPAALADLSLDGKIDVTIQASSGDFYFAHSILTAQVTPGIRDLAEPRSASVPVPSTLLLLGAGLMGLGLRSRSGGAQPA